MIIFIASLCLALGVSFICSLMEATLLSLTPSQIAEISKKHPKTGEIWQKFKANIERPIAVILTLNTAAHTIGASIAGSQFDKLFGTKWIWLFSLLFTFVMLQYTEILPKTLGVSLNKKIAVWIAGPLSSVIHLFTPLIYFLHALNRPFERRHAKSNTPSTVDEIASLAMMAFLSKNIGSHQERIITRATKLSHTPASEIMIPIEQVSMLSTSHTLIDALIAAHIDAHTRFPVCQDGDRSRVIGFVNFKELVYYMRTNPRDPSLIGIIRPVYFAKSDARVSDILKAFVDQHEHIAIVQDDAGYCVGLITLEDIIEELVGDIQDEFDRLPRLTHSLSGGTWMFGGGVPVSEVFTKLGGESINSTATIAAWLENQIGYPVKAGQTFRHEEIDFMIRRVRRGKIFEVSASRKLPATPATQPA